MRLIKFQLLIRIFTIIEPQMRKIFSDHELGMLKLPFYADEGGSYLNSENLAWR